MKFRPDLLDGESLPGLEVFQITDEPGVPHCHVYMEARVFTPDSRALVLHRWAHPHGPARDDAEHRYILCDVDNGGELIPLTDEKNVRAPAVSPDGRYMYYFVDETRLNGGRLILKRVTLDGVNRDIVAVLDRPPAGATTQPSHIYSLSTISVDGKRIAISGFLGDGRTEPPPWGLIVFDIEGAKAWVPFADTEIYNSHLQYCRSTDPEAGHDIMVQQDHGSVFRADGTAVRGVAWSPDDGPGMDIHVIRDNGTNLRDMPWGRDGREYCGGHQCWRGEAKEAIAGVWITENTKQGRLMEGRAAPHAGHLGVGTPGAERNDLSRSFSKPFFCHFGTDTAGKRLITDHGWGEEHGCSLYVARLGRPLLDPLTDWQYVLDTRTVFNNGHPHPFLSPDGRKAFFNSNESGINQAYMIRGLQ